MRRPTDRLDAYLDAGEETLWTGQPRQGVVFRWPDLILVPFSLLWTGLVFGMAGVSLIGAGSENAGGRAFLMIFLVPFVLVGLYMTVGRFWTDARQRARTVYAVTDQRVLIVSGLFRASAKSLNLRTISDLTMTERPDGSGTITFGPSPFPAFFQPMIQMSMWGMSVGAPMFDTVPDVASVYRTVRDASRRESS